MGEISDSAEAHHAGGAFESMCSTADTLNQLTIGGSFFQGCHMHNDCLQVFFSLKTEDFRGLFTKIATKG